MIRITRFALCALLLCLLAGSVSAQSLGDAAKQLQSSKPKTKASKVYTNDDIPSSTTMKDESKTDAKDAKGDAAKDGDAKTGEKSDASAAEDKKKAQQEWKDKIAGQKKAIADLEREINLMDREYKLRAAVFYGDAGNRLRDDKKWADEERKYQEDAKKKRAELQDAQNKLETMREQARKAGVSGALD